MYQVVGKLISFASAQPWAEMGARLVGLSVKDIWHLVPCIMGGTKKANGYTMTDAGSCAGKLTSELLDAKM